MRQGSAINIRCGWNSVLMLRCSRSIPLPFTRVNNCGQYIYIYIYKYIYPSDG